MTTAFRDQSFQNKLVAFICRDRNFLKETSYLLEADDFKPRKEEGIERWIVASTALNYYRKYRDPIGDMLRSEMLDFARKQNYGESQRKTLLLYVKHVMNLTLTGGEHIVERVLAYKRERMKLDALEELMELQAQGELTDQKWLEICKKGVDSFNGNNYQISDIFDEKEIEGRITRRERQTRKRYPYLLIDPVDANIRCVTRGQLGLLLAPYKKGKSLGLVHIGVSTALQGYNTLFFTLEDPKPDVEDRIDANVANLPVKRLHEMPVKFRHRIDSFKRFVRGKLKVIDGTEGGMTIDRIIEICELERNRGFLADVLIIDYDDEIVPSVKRKERRMEFADIYRDLRQFLSKAQMIGWTAAQTQRNTENKKIISGGTVAEDISKIRKVTMAMGLGQGDWGEDSLYLFIAAHKFDRMHIGWNIMTDRERMLFYDRDATKAMMKKELRSKEEEEEEVI